MTDPDFIIPGFSKCGTTALAEYLNQHPDVLLDPKEPRAFYDAGAPRWATTKRNQTQMGAHSLMPLQDYRKVLYQNKQKVKLVGDGSQCYTYKFDFTKKVKSVTNAKKAIIMIRKSEARLVSLYFFKYQHHQESFENWLKYYFSPDIEDFYYFDKVKSLHEQFGSDLLVLKSEDLRSDYQKLVNRVFDHLGVSHIALEKVKSNVSPFGTANSSFYKKAMSSLMNASSAVAKPFKKILPESLQTRLRRFHPYKFFVSSARKNAKNDNKEEFLKQIPKGVLDSISEDYNKTLEYCKQNKLI